MYKLARPRISDVITVDVVIKRSRRHAVVAGIASASIVASTTLTHRATLEAVCATGAVSCSANHAPGRARVGGGSDASALHTHVPHVLQTDVHVQSDALLDRQPQKRQKREEVAAVGSSSFVESRPQSHTPVINRTICGDVQAGTTKDERCHHCGRRDKVGPVGATPSAASTCIDVGDLVKKIDDVKGHVAVYDARRFTEPSFY